MKIDSIVQKQKKFFQTGKTLSVDFRIKMLKRLYRAITKHEEEINEALRHDLGKSDFESYKVVWVLIMEKPDLMHFPIQRAW